MNNEGNQKTDRQPLFYVLAFFAVIICLGGLAIRHPFHFLLPLLQAAGLMVTVTIYGVTISGFFKRFRTHEATFPQLFGIGLMATTFFMTVISFFQILAPGVIAYFITAVVLALLRLKNLKQTCKAQVFTFFKRPAALYGLFLLPLMFAGLPSTFYDTLVYHLGIPNLYLQHGGFAATPQLLYANTSIYYEMSLIPAVFTGELTPRLFHFFIGMVFLFAVADFAKRRLNLEKSTLLILVLISTPVTFFLVTTIKNDLLSAYFLLLVVDAHLDKQTIRCGLFSGFALGVKYFNGAALAIFFLVMLGTAFKEKELKEVLVKRLPLVGIMAAVVLVPLFIKNAIYAGNPFFPFFYQHFTNPFFDSSRFAVMQADVGKMVRNVNDFLLLPFTISFRELGSGGLTGVQYLAFLPFLFTATLPKKRPPLLIFSLLFLGVGALFTGSIRFMYISLALTAPFVVLACMGPADPAVPGTNKRFKILHYLLFIIIAVNGMTTLAYHEQFYMSHPLYTGKTDIEGYKAERFPTYPAIAYVNRETPKESKILLVGEGRNFYIHRRYTAASALDYCILKPFLARSVTHDDFLSALAADGYDYMIYNQKEFARLNNHYQRLNTEETARWNYFAGKLTPVFNQGALFVYKIPKATTPPNKDIPKP